MEIKMSAPSEVDHNGAPVGQTGLCVNMESVNRISKLPVVESTIQTATSVYSKVKDYNSVTNWTLATTENAVHKAIEVGKPLAAPVVSHLQGPIKKVDGMLCTGLDYVESKIPAVKLPPEEILLQMYSSTKQYVNTTVAPTVQSAYAVVQPAVQTAKVMVEPAVQAAKHAVEPAVQSARQIAEPLVQPAMEKVSALKEKVEGFLHLNEESGAPKPTECDECLEQGEKHQSEKSPQGSPHH